MRRRSQSRYSNVKPRVTQKRRRSHGDAQHDSPPRDLADVPDLDCVDRGSTPGDRAVNKAEYPFLGVVAHEYRSAVTDIDACISTAIAICSTTDPDRAATLEACRIAVLQGLDVIDGILAPNRSKES